jgi:hypothetical protein
MSALSAVFTCRAALLTGASPFLRATDSGELIGAAASQPYRYKKYAVDTIVQLFPFNGSGLIQIANQTYIEIEDDAVNTKETFFDSTYTDQIGMAERELSAFISAVTKSFGPTQARLAAEDWLDESDLMDSSPRPSSRDWRAVTIAASARLANRLTAASHPRASSATLLCNLIGTSHIEANDTKVSPIRSSNCF